MDQIDVNSRFVIKVRLDIVVNSVSEVVPAAHVELSASSDMDRVDIAKPHRLV